MVSAGKPFPPLPEIGHPESHYALMAKLADREGNYHLHEAAKVGQYVTLATDPKLKWEQKLRYFQHALRRHCVPPRFAGDDVWLFYHNLADLVREHCGREALRIASKEDDFYAARLSMGQNRDKIETDAELLFDDLMSGLDHCPDWFTSTDWLQLKLLRDQWI